MNDPFAIDDRDLMSNAEIEHDWRRNQRGMREDWLAQQIASQQAWTADIRRVRRVWKILEVVWHEHDAGFGWDILEAIRSSLGRNPEQRDLTPVVVMQAIERVTDGQCAWYRDAYAAWLRTQSNRIGGPWGLFIP